MFFCDFMVLLMFFSLFIRLLILVEGFNCMVIFFVFFFKDFLMVLLVIFEGYVLFIINDFFELW